MRTKFENNIWKLRLKDEIEKKLKFYKRVKDKNYKLKEHELNPKTKQIEEQLLNFGCLSAKTIK